MNRPTRAPSFVEGVLVAAVLSLFGGALHQLLRLPSSHHVSQDMAASDTYLLAIVVVSLCYLLYLLWRSPGSAGRISTVLLWVGISLPMLLLAPHWSLAVQLALLWLTRSLFFQHGVSAALGDLGLMLVGLGAGLWAIAATGSLAAAIWTFLLVQAPFVALGGFLSPSGTSIKADRLDDNRFERAEQSATSSLRRLAGAGGRR